MSSRNRIFILLGILGVCVVAAAGLHLFRPKPEIVFRFKVPANSRIAMLWESDDGTGKRIDLRANPGQQIKVSIEKGDPVIPALDQLPPNFFMETLPETGNTAQLDPSLEKHIRLVKFENQPMIRSRFRFFWESYEHPFLAELRKREKLDQVVEGAKTEFELFTRILKWTHQQWEVGNPNPYPPWNALVILDWIRSGKTKGFCAQYAQVMVQALLAFGHQARYVSLANHEVLEVWSNEYAQWVTMDPNDGVYYTDGKKPLNSYEIYASINESRVDTIQTVGAPPNPNRIRSYGVFSISTRNDHLSQGRPASEYLRDMWKERVHLIDQYSKALPYHEGKLRPITPLTSDLYFPINTAHVKILRPIGKDSVEIWLDTLTPGFATFAASTEGKNFEHIRPRHQWKIHSGKNEIRLVSINRRGVRGPETRIEVEKRAEYSNQ